MLIRDLLQSVTVAESARDYWEVQVKLAAALEGQERIVRRRQRHHRGFREAIRRSGERSAGSVQGLRERRERLQKLLAANQHSEDECRFARASLLYLGDALAYKMMPEHWVRMQGRNSSPGWFGGKTGRAQEREIGAFLTGDGWKVLMHDLTHCLRIGDLTAVCPERGILSLEVGSGGGDRKHRQIKRMNLLNRVLRQDVSDICKDELVANRFPSRFLEANTELRYNTEAFVEVSKCDATGWKVVQPEEGLIYVGHSPGRRTEDVVREVARIGRTWSDYTVGWLSDRIMGKYSWVPAITSLSIPTEHIARVLEHKFYFWVFIDIDHMRRRLATLVPSLVVSEYGGHLRFESRNRDWHVLRGPRPIEGVKYGLASLESALQMLAEEPQFDPDEQRIASATQDSKSLI